MANARCRGAICFIQHPFNEEPKLLWFYLGGQKFRGGDNLLWTLRDYLQRNRNKPKPAEESVAAWMMMRFFEYTYPADPSDQLSHFHVATYLPDDVDAPIVVIDIPKQEVGVAKGVWDVQSEQLRRFSFAQLLAFDDKKMKLFMAGEDPDSELEVEDLKQKEEDEDSDEDDDESEDEDEEEDQDEKCSNCGEKPEDGNGLDDEGNCWDCRKQECSFCGNDFEPDDLDENERCEDCRGKSTCDGCGENFDDDDLEDGYCEKCRESDE